MITRLPHGFLTDFADFLLNSSDGFITETQDGSEYNFKCLVTEPLVEYYRVCWKYDSPVVVPTHLVIFKTALLRRAPEYHQGSRRTCSVGVGGCYPDLGAQCFDDRALANARVADEVNREGLLVCEQSRQLPQRELE